MQKTELQNLARQAIFIDGKDRTEEIDFYTFEGGKCLVTYKNNSKTYSYQAGKVKIVKSALGSSKARHIFSYLKEIAENIGLKTDEGHNVLANSYNNITFIPETAILADYLNGKQSAQYSEGKATEIFPFGFNLSQKNAVDFAFSNPLSVIEGPPGTGKTQTILNIIANAVMNDKSVAVVSSNNSATKNVYEKLEKSGIEYIAALLGSVENKKEFIKAQSEIPDLSCFCLTAQEEVALKESNASLFVEITEKLSLKNELALLKLQTDKIKTEYLHFEKDSKTLFSIPIRKNIHSDDLLKLWMRLDDFEQAGKKLYWWRQLSFPFIYGVGNRDFYRGSYNE